MIHPDINLRFGGVSGGSENKFKPYNGLIDDFRVYDRKLTHNDIYALYTYPDKPFMCDAFEIINFEINCTQCRGNRIKIKNLCECPEGFYNDFSNLENCKVLK